MSETEIKILLIDDREDNLVSLQTVLEKDGYVMRKARSGNDALKILLHEIDFTLIIIDVYMPNLNGFETASLIYSREKLKHIPIIFITANSNDGNAYRGYQAGAIDFIYKPINPDLLRAKVSVFVDLYRKTHMLMIQEKVLLQINNDLEDRVKARTEELQRKNVELENKNTELTRVNHDLDNFIYTASHDLKAPILNLEGLITALFESMDTPEEYRNQIKDMTIISVNRLKNTIAELSEISKVQKEISEDVQEVRIDQLANEVILSIKDAIESSQADIQFQFGINEIRFSRKNLRSILYNLISNAVKYNSPKRKPVIHVKTKSEGGHIVLSVSDNGLGIKPENKHKLFEMYTRLHDHVEGSGIGLYIVKRIIENNGGKIEVESLLDVGSTFSIYFQHKKPVVS